MINKDNIINRTSIPRWIKVVIAMILSVLVLQCVMSLRQKSPTWDETHYLGIGKHLLTHFAWDIRGSILHPPLTFFLHDIPLLFFSIPEIKPLGEQENQAYRVLADVERGNDILMSDKYDGETLFFLSRLFMIPISVLLGIFVFLWARDLYSNRAGLFSLFLYCFSPNILAHARLITPDLSLTCFSFLSIYFYWEFTTLEKRSRDSFRGEESNRFGQLLESRPNFLRWFTFKRPYRHLIFSGLFLGLALASKYSALVLFPVFMIIFIINAIIDFFSSVSYSVKMLRKDSLDLLLLFCLAVIPILIFYRFDLSPYFDGVVFQLEKSKWGHAAFLNGTISWRGWWYFLIYAFLLKTPIPTLVFIIIALTLGSYLDAILQKREFFLIIPVLCFIVFFSYNHQCIGLRYILPVYPFLFVFAGRVFDVKIKCHKVIVGLVMGLSLWYLAGTMMIHPHYLAYFNEFAGGPSKGYAHLVDSNLDWGQDLKLLKRYIDNQEIKEIYLDYFGSVDPVFYGIEYKKIDEYTSPLPMGWCAVSATKLQGVYSRARENAYAELKQRKPIAQIGYSIFVYYIE